MQSFLVILVAIAVGPVSCFIPGAVPAVRSSTVTNGIFDQFQEGLAGLQKPKETSKAKPTAPKGTSPTYRATPSRAGKNTNAKILQSKFSDVSPLQAQAKERDAKKEVARKKSFVERKKKGWSPLDENKIGDKRTFVQLKYAQKGEAPAPATKKKKPFSFGR